MARTAQRSVEAVVFDYLAVPKRYSRASDVANVSGNTGSARLMDICTARGAGRYLNPIGGKSMYDRAAFSRRGIELNFLKMHDVRYPTPVGVPFLPNMSIIDILMCISRQEARELLTEFDLE